MKSWHSCPLLWALTVLISYSCPQHCCYIYLKWPLFFIHIPTFFVISLSGLYRVFCCYCYCCCCLFLPKSAIIALWDKESSIQVVILIYIQIFSPFTCIRHKGFFWFLCFVFVFVLGQLLKYYPNSLVFTLRSLISNKVMLLTDLVASPLWRCHCSDRWLSVADFQLFASQVSSLAYLLWFGIFVCLWVLVWFGF